MKRTPLERFLDPPLSVQSLHIIITFQVKEQRRSTERAVASQVKNNLTISNLEKKLEGCEEALVEMDRASLM